MFLSQTYDLGCVIMLEYTYSMVHDIFRIFEIRFSVYYEHNLVSKLCYSSYFTSSWSPKYFLSQFLYTSLPVCVIFGHFCQK